MGPRALIFANGRLPNLEAARLIIRPSDFVIAIDGGSCHALALGLTPSLILGDMDSLPAGLQYLVKKAGTRFLKYPRDKDATDLELALQHALGQNFHSMVIVAAGGGRLDQTLANLALLSDQRLAEADVRLDDGVEEAFFVRREAEIRGAIGDIVSLLPWGGEVAGVITKGLKWPLHDETLYPSQTRGISNEMLQDEARVLVRSGLLLVVHSRLYPQ